MTLGEALPKEIARVRDEIMPGYILIGDPGKYALTMMRASMDKGIKALAEQDVDAMMQAYHELLGFTA